MLRRSGDLCVGPEPEACADCVGEGHRADLVIRNLRLQRMIASIDHFISPSQFLKDRYVDWGLSSSQISVVENLPAERPVVSRFRKTDINQELVVGFFGQVNPWKGVGLIIEAVRIARVNCPQLRLEINGCDHEDLNSVRSPYPELVKHLRSLLNSPGLDGVQLCGRYEPHQLSARMASVDLVVMGSTWYENAPMVIQEAFLHGKPVIAPALGGMAEKVSDGYSGLLFQPGDAVDLARVMQRCCHESSLVEQLQHQVQSMPLQGEHVLEQHKNLYDRFRGEFQSVAHYVRIDDELLNDLRLNFEPLGANCELGFLMAQLGINRSCLFRWLFTPLASLECVLSEKLQGFFSDPEAVKDPVMASDMVVDRRTGIFFHAKELRVVLEKAEINETPLDQLSSLDVYRQQHGKYLYLTEKFLATVSDYSTLHVFSDFHQELSEAGMVRIMSCLRAMGKPPGSVLLFVRACSEEDEVNRVTSLGDGLQLATIRQLAPGEHADRIDLEAWIEVLSRSRQLQKTAI